MKKILLGCLAAITYIVLAVALGTSSLPAAKLPYSCDSLETYARPSGENYKECTSDVSTLIDSLEEAVQWTWKVALNPISIFQIAPLEEMRSTERLGVRFSAVYTEVLTVLEPNADCSTDKCFSGLRAMFADPAKLATTYNANTHLVMEAIKSAAIIGSVYSDIIELKPLLDKPFDPGLGARSAGWYEAGCWMAEEAQYDAEVCKSDAGYGIEFKAHYGVDATANRAWALAFLFRRHREGGQMLVAQYQRIGKDIWARLENND